MQIATRCCVLLLQLCYKLDISPWLSSARFAELSMLRKFLILHIHVRLRNGQLFSSSETIKFLDWSSLGIHRKIDARHRFLSKWKVKFCSETIIQSCKQLNAKKKSHASYLCCRSFSKMGSVWEWCWSKFEEHQLSLELATLLTFRNFITTLDITDQQTPRRASEMHHKK